MPMDFWGKLGNAVGGREDPFIVRYGPTPNCFSANDIVRMFRLGATARDVDHLSACGACMERIKRFSLATGSEMLKFEAYPAREQKLIGGARLALLHIPAPVPVVIGSNFAEPILVNMTTGLESKCQDLNLRLEGSIVAKAEHPMAASAGAGWAEVVFQNPHISPEVMKELQRHGGVTDQVMLHAVNSENQIEIVGTSNIELKAKL